MAKNIFLHSMMDKCLMQRKTLKDKNEEKRIEKTSNMSAATAKFPLVINHETIAGASRLSED